MATHSRGNVQERPVANILVGNILTTIGRVCLLCNTGRGCSLDSRVHEVYENSKRNISGTKSRVLDDFVGKNQMKSPFSVHPVQYFAPVWFYRIIIMLLLGKNIFVEKKYTSGSRELVVPNTHRRKIEQICKYQLGKP